MIRVDCEMLVTSCLVDGLCLRFWFGILVNGLVNCFCVTNLLVWTAVVSDMEPRFGNWCINAEDYIEK